RRIQTPIAPVRFCLWLGAASAVLAAGLGWLHALDQPASQTLFLHRWLGTGAGVVAPMAAFLFERDLRRRQHTTLTTVLVIAVAVLVGIAGHFGGMLTYGTSYFLP